jgi:hypothetical protein
MRQRQSIQIMFEPGRLSADHLRRAYELVAPVVKREARDASVGQDPPHQYSCERPQQEGRAA